jgi:uncharacterized membrane protein
VAGPSEDLEEQVRRLTERLAEVEKQLADVVAGAPAQQPAGPAQAQVEPAASVTLEQGEAPAEPSPPEAAGAEEQPKPAEEKPAAEPDRPDEPQREWWQVGALRTVPAESFPVVVMSAAGGLALLLGLLYLVWYSIQQGWFPVELRLVIGGTLGIAAMVYSWRLGGRGMAAVAGALGGAGLGAWFGTILVARHVHELLSAYSAFAFLAFGAAMGLVIAGHRRLRFFATLATLGAFLTPLVTSTGQDRLNELMIYQLVVLIFLYVLEEARRWPELGHLGLACTWILMFTWAAEHLDQGSQGRMMVWSFALLAIAHSQAFQLIRRGNLAGGHAVVRLWLNGAVAWFAGSAATSSEQDAAWVALAMAVVHGVLFLLLRRSPGSRHASVACVVVGWLQLFAFAPLRWSDGDETGLWWAAMSTLVVIRHIATRDFRVLGLLVLPLGAGYLWAMNEAMEARLALPIGICLAGLLLVVALWPRPEEEEEPWAAIVCLAIGWLLLFSIAPRFWDGTPVGLWWAAMSSVAVVALVMKRDWRIFHLLPLPLLVGVGWSVLDSSRAEWALPIGLWLAGLLLLVGLWPRFDELEEESKSPEEYNACPLAVGYLLWMAVAWTHMQDWSPQGGPATAVCLAPLLAMVVRVRLAPTPARAFVTVAILAALVVHSTAAAQAAGLFEPVVSPGTGRHWHIATLAVVAVMAWSLGSLRGAADTASWRAQLRGLAGVVRPAALAMLSMLVVSALAPRLTRSPEMTASLNQAGWSVVWAVTGLSLLLRALWAGNNLWARVGFFVLAATAIKLVMVDLTRISMALRVLSFMGLGLCLLGGAYAYKRLGERLRKPDENPEQ